MTPEYKKWVSVEAKKIHSDGCSHVLEINRHCCYEHDLGYYYGRDPWAAYLSNSWDLAPQIERSEVDARFRKCNGPLVGWYRWLGVRIGGRDAWKRHRRERP